ncbi:hypothetical protein LCGC14_1356570 [marine sediment metagenome]|uniref:Uncharacterized protein n=1 Tax=marine sediment metagenome TaxID=412755 RepID=A0A0F9K9C8_9ZZZZ
MKEGKKTLDEVVLLSTLDAFTIEERRLERFEAGDIIVDTCAASDSDRPYETAIQHPDYKGGLWIVVELYDTKAEARLGHYKWMALMMAGKPPDELRDVSTRAALMCDPDGLVFRRGEEGLAP